MTKIAKEKAPKALLQFISGDISWRMACKELGLWEYDDLLAMIQEYGLKYTLPSRGNSGTSTLEARIHATVKDQE